MASLAASIREVGVLQPVLVRETAVGDFELIAGERRWRAARRAGLQTMPVLVQSVSDVHSLEQALVENLHREDLDPLEEAGAFQQLVDGSGTPTSRSRPGWERAGRPSPTPSGCCSCRPGCSALLADRDHQRRPRPGPAGDPGPQLPGELAKRTVAEGLTVRASKSSSASMSRESTTSAAGPTHGGLIADGSRTAEGTAGVRTPPPARFPRPACSSSKTSCPITSTPG